MVLGDCWSLKDGRQFHTEGGGYGVKISEVRSLCRRSPVVRCQQGLLPGKLCCGQVVRWLRKDQGLVI